MKDSLGKTICENDLVCYTIGNRSIAVYIGRVVGVSKQYSSRVIKIEQTQRCLINKRKYPIILRSERDLIALSYKEETLKKILDS